jgi:Fe2+ or Zn2+ uptake regulation protein
MWAIDELAQENEQCFPSLLIKHPANRFYKPKTIYNTINVLTEQGKIVKLPSRRLELSDSGQAEIDGLKKVQEIKEKKRRGTLRV